MSVHVDGDREGYFIVRWREDGRHRTRRGFTSRASATEFDALKRRESRLGAHGVAEPAAVRLETWLADWWERYAVGWRRSTQLERSPILKKWVVPYIGRVRLRDLGEARIRGWRNQIVRDGCSANRANAAIRVLSAALTAAVRERLIPSNPIIGELRIERLPHRVERPRVLAPIEIEAIRLQLPTARDRLIVSLCAYAGLRPEEVCALRWTSVSGQALTIDEAYTAGELGQTKTGGRRVVPIVAPLLAELQAWREAYLEATGEKPAPGALVAPAERGAHLAWGYWRDRLWKPARTAARVDERGTKVAYCRPYDLRHSYASMMIHEGRPVNQVAAWMGHGQATTTLKHYAHLFDEAQMGASLPMVDAITAARESLYKSKRSRFVPGEGEDEAWWAEWLSLMWPGFTPQSGRRGSNPRPQAWESPKKRAGLDGVVQVRGDEASDDDDPELQDSARPGTPDVPEMFPDGQSPRHREDLERAAQLAREIGAPVPLEDTHVGAGPGQVELARRTHERMAAGELVSADDAFGRADFARADDQEETGGDTRAGFPDRAIDAGPDRHPDAAHGHPGARGGTPRARRLDRDPDDIRGGGGASRRRPDADPRDAGNSDVERTGLAGARIGGEPGAAPSPHAGSTSLASGSRAPVPPTAGREEPDRPAREGAATATRALPSHRGDTEPAAVGRGADGGDRQSATARPTARRRGTHPAAPAGHDHPDRRHAHAAQASARRWWRSAAHERTRR